MSAASTGPCCPLSPTRGGGGAVTTVHPHLHLTRSMTWRMPLSCSGTSSVANDTSGVAGLDGTQWHSGHGGRLGGSAHTESSTGSASFHLRAGAASAEQGATVAAPRQAQSRGGGAGLPAPTLKEVADGKARLKLGMTGPAVASGHKLLGLGADGEFGAGTGQLAGRKFGG